MANPHRHTHAHRQTGTEAKPHSLKFFWEHCVTNKRVVVVRVSCASAAVAAQRRPLLFQWVNGTLAQRAAVVASRCLRLRFGQSRFSAGAAIYGQGLLKPHLHGVCTAPSTVQYAGPSVKVKLLAEYNIHPGSQKLQPQQQQQRSSSSSAVSQVKCDADAVYFFFFFLFCFGPAPQPKAAAGAASRAAAAASVGAV